MTTQTPAELRALIEAASPLPWTSDLAPRISDADGHGVTCDCVAFKDAALITAAVNALGPHLDRIAALEAALRELCDDGHGTPIGLLERARALLESKS